MRARILEPILVTVLVILAGCALKNASEKAPEGAGANCDDPLTVLPAGATLSLDLASAYHDYSLCDATSGPDRVLEWVPADSGMATFAAHAAGVRLAVTTACDGFGDSASNPWGNGATCDDSSGADGDALIHMLVTGGTKYFVAVAARSTQPPPESFAVDVILSTARPGDACAADADCPGGTCATTGFPQGYCTWPCDSSDSCNGFGVCQPLCSSPPCDQLTCMSGCVSDGDCRAGYGCRDLFDGTRSCRPVGSLPEGADCAGDGECATGNCSMSVGRKRCVQWCLSSSTCSGGELCSLNPAHSFVYRCGPSCGSGTCAYGSTCTCFDAGEKGCAPRCAFDSDCALGSRCDTTTGLCQRLSCAMQACPTGSFCNYRFPYDEATCSTSPAQPLCSPTGTSGADLLQTCGADGCKSAECAGAGFAGQGYCTQACPNNMACPGGTSCGNAIKTSSGVVSTVQLCIKPPAQNQQGPCSTTSQCPSPQTCQPQGYCTGGPAGSPCPSKNPVNDCAATVQYCSWYGTETPVCSVKCSTNDDCTGQGFPGGCCKAVNNSTLKLCFPSTSGVCKT